MNCGRGYQRDSDNQRLKMGAPVLYQQHPRWQWPQCTSVRVIV